MSVGWCHILTGCLADSMQFCNPAEHIMKLVYISAEEHNPQKTEGFVAKYQESSEAKDLQMQLSVCFA
jgi:hypothetical protein